jgi:hypothetical protein
METFNYSAEAELFPGRSLRSRVRSVGYKRFVRAADAIKFAIEELPQAALAGACLQIDEERFDARDIRHLYERSDFPLPRRPPQAERRRAHAPKTTHPGGKTASWNRS